MAKKKAIPVEAPELPVTLDLNQFKELSVDELFGLISWVKKRQTQVLTATKKKLEKEKLAIIKKQEGLAQEAKTIADERAKVEAELSQFGDTNKKVEAVEKKLTDASEKIKTYTARKKEFQVKLKDFQTKNTELFSVREKLHKVEKKEQNLEAQKNRLVSYANAKGYKVDKIVTEIGSGLNDKRPKLEKQANANG